MQILNRKSNNIYSHALSLIHVLFCCCCCLTVCQYVFMSPSPLLSLRPLVTCHTGKWMDELMMQCLHHEWISNESPILRHCMKTSIVRELDIWQQPLSRTITYAIIWRTSSNSCSWVTLYVMDAPFMPGHDHVLPVICGVRQVSLESCVGSNSAEDDEVKI